MEQFFWIFKCGVAVWMAWRVVIMLGALNPLMAMGFAFAFIIAGPIATAHATEWISIRGDPFGVCELLGFFQIGAQLPFAFIGVLVSLMCERVSVSAN